MRNDAVEATAALSVLSQPYLQSEYKSRDINYEQIFFNSGNIKSMLFAEDLTCKC